MSWLREIVLRLQAALEKGHQDAALDEELDTHLTLLIEQNIERGMSPETARREAKLQLGGRDQIKESVHDHRGLPLFDTLRQNVHYALRMLRKSPGFTAVAVLTLALGIGANTAIFSLIDGILMRSLPVQDPQSLVVLKWRAHKVPDRHNSSSYGDCKQNYAPNHGPATACSFSEPFFHDVAAHANVFSNVAAFANAGQLDLSGNGTASLLRAQGVSGEFFALLGVRAAAGRLIMPRDDSPSASPVVVLNYGYWETQFGGDPSAVGKTVRLNNVPFTIIGVADSRFNSLSPGRVYDAWVPLSVTPQLASQPWVKTRATDVYSWWLVIIGRLTPGVSRTEAQAAVTTLFQNAMLHGPKPFSKPEDDPRVDALPAQSGLTGVTQDISRELYVLMSAVGIVLLIACANVAGLLLSRATARQKEMAVRLALGAGRTRIVGQLLTESMLLSLVGGAVGILFAEWGTRAIVSLMASNSDQPLGFSPGIDWRVLAFTLATSAATGLIFGLAPALRSTRLDLTPALKERVGSSAGESRASGRWLNVGNGLVVAQVTLAVVVLVGAGLLVRTLQKLRNIDPGFDTRNVLTFELDPTLIGYKTPQIDSFYRNLQQRLGTLPGVESVSYSSDTLLSGSLWSTGFHLRGTPKDQISEADYLQVGADFFSMMRMRVLAGRSFTSADFAAAEIAQENATARESAQDAKEAGALPEGSTTPATSAANEAPIPVIVNKTLVQKYFPKVNPLGQHFGEREADPEKGDWASPGWAIVGVVNDAKYDDLRGAIEPTIYAPASGRNTSFELRTAANPGATTSAVRSAVSQMDSNLPVFNVHTQTELIDRLLFQERIIAKLSGFFGVLALVLACIGLYGLLSYEVSRRTREIGIRVALGARPGDVLRLIVGQGMILVVVGLVVGLGVALSVTRYLQSMLYDLHATDPVTMIAVGALLGLVAFIACYNPARRAVRVDPMVALRYE
jgi:predicted permease